MKVCRKRGLAGGYCHFITEHLTSHGSWEGRLARAYFVLLPQKRSDLGTASPLIGQLSPTRTQIKQILNHSRADQLELHPSAAPASIRMPSSILVLGCRVLVTNAYALMSLDKCSLNILALGCKSKVQTETTSHRADAIHCTPALTTVAYPW